MLSEQLVLLPSKSCQSYHGMSHQGPWGCALMLYLGGISIAGCPLWCSAGAGLEAETLCGDMRA